MTRPSAVSLAIVPVATLALLAGCAGPAAAPAADIDEAPAAIVTVENCGTEVSFEAAPERVLTIKSTSAEMLLALGLGDRIIGTAFSDGPVPEEWADAAASVPVLSDKVPGQEAVLGAEPDLVYAGWESNFSAEGAGERAGLHALGVDTYVSPAACKGEYRPERLDFDEIFAEIEEVAAIFRTDATELIGSQRDTVSGISPDERGLTALWFSSGSDTPYVGAGRGAPQLIMDTIGLENIAGDIDDTWASFNWEAVVDANPDVIVLVDSAWGTVEKKIGVLEGNPATANLDAVREGRYLVIPFTASEAGVRTAGAAAELAAQLVALEF